VRGWAATAWMSGFLLCVSGAAGAQSASSLDPRVAVYDVATEHEVSRETATPDPQTVEPPPAAKEKNDIWLDRTQESVHDMASATAMRIDRMFGSTANADAYSGAYGSIAPSLLWDEFDGWRPRVRFRVNLPLPSLNKRLNAFIGRVDREEYVSERAQQSGALPRQYGPPAEEQTLAGIVYRTPSKQGSHFDAGAGIRLRSPLDPYVKGSYVYERGKSETGLIALRQTLFWQNSEQAGFTSRIDLERVVSDNWMLRWTTSGTISQESSGVFGYSSIMALCGLPNRRAFVVAAGLDGETDAEVPLHDFGFKVAWRQSVVRDWLVLEVRSSLTWPKEHRDQPREPSWGVGLGFEMFFGTDEFLARPATF